MLPLLGAIDPWRRLAGDVLEGMGLGPAGTPHTVMATGSPASIRRYRPARPVGRTVLLVPAPIKAPYLWDLLPRVSVVRRCLAAGLDVGVLEWPRRPGDRGRMGLTDYVEGMLSAAVETLERDCPGQPVFVAGHSLGGTFAALFAARHPRRIAGLALLGAPLHFGPAIGALGRLLASIDRPSALISRLDRIPGTLLTLSGVAAAPAEFLLARGADLCASVGDVRALQLHLAVERWALDEAALPRQLMMDVLQRLYRDDAFFQGQLAVSGRCVSPADIRVPVFCVVEPGCPIAPPDAVLPALEADRHAECTVVRFRGAPGESLQHLGMIVGREAHRRLWPELIAWTLKNRTSA
jgi:polyhydroxyalkanoate synthase